MTSLEMLKVTTAPVPVSRERFASRIPLASTGIQSYIEVGEVDGVPAIRKVSGRELSTDTISTLLPIFPEYRKSLIHAGLCLPASLSVHACNGGIELVDEYVEGRDIDVMIRIKDPRTQQAWMEMIKQLCRANDGAHQSQAMIDAKPANFIISNDVLFYVDFFPPMLMDTDGMITPWVPEIYKRDHRMMSFNFGDTRGQITKLLAGSQLEYPDMYQHLETWTLQAIEGKLSRPHATIYSRTSKIKFSRYASFLFRKKYYSKNGGVKKMKVYLIRHAKTRDAENQLTQKITTPVVINTETLNKVKQAKNKIEAVETVYCSPMKRAKETADLIFGKDSYKILDFIQEYRTPKEIIGKPKGYATRFWEVKHKKDKMDIDWTPEGGESFASIAKRAKKLHRFLLKKKRINKYNKVAIVGHGTFFRHFLLCAAGIPWTKYPQLIFDVLRKLKWDNLQIIEMEI